MKKIFVAFLLLFSALNSFSQAPYYGMTPVEFQPGQWMLVKLPPVYNNPAWSSYQFPVMFNFPGNGETSQYGGVTILFNQGYPKRVKDGKELYPLGSDGQPIYYIAICPQPYASGSFSNEGSMRAVWNYAVTNYRIDTSKYASGPYEGMYQRVMYAGLSAGAIDIHNQYVSQYNPYWGPTGYRNRYLGKFMSASAPYLQFADSIHRVANRRLIAFAGEIDGYPDQPGNRVFINATTDLVNKFNTYTPGSANLTVIAGQGHTSVVWDSAWSTLNPPVRNLYRLMMDDFADAPVGNQDPVALAGTDLTIQPGTNISLNAAPSYDPDGTIVSYAWTKQSGPAATIVSPTTSGTLVTGLTTGVYVFRVTVTDDDAATDFDEVQVTVQAPPNSSPTANAGTDIFLTLPTNSTQLNGSASVDADGNITQYVWLKVSGGNFTIDNTSSVTPNISGLVAGEYVFQLTVTDNNGAMGVDQVKVVVATAGGVTKIPLDYRRFNQVNNFGTTLEKLVDGDVTKSVVAGSGRILKNFDVWYEFPPEWDVQVSQIRGYDPPGGWFGEPCTVYGIQEGSWTRELLGVFTGEFNNPNGGWVELNFAPKPLRYIILNTYSTGGDHFPNELEVYGTYTNVPLNAFPIPKKNYENLFGANLYVWNVTQNSMFPFVGYQPYAPKMDLINPLSATRVYINWDMIEDVKDQYKWNPSYKGDWSIDTALYTLSRNGKFPLVTIKSVPSWWFVGFPAGEQGGEAVPAPYVNPLGSNFDEPTAYLQIAKAWFQFVRRYGSNPSLTGVTVAAGQKLRAGLNYITHIEIENERDKWWIGRRGFQTGREFGAMLSAIYDGHNGTMGPYVGVMAADPTIAANMVIGGTAQPQTDWMKGAYDWWQEFRPETPWPFSDNWHNYSYNWDYTTDETKHRGIAPEVSLLGLHMDEHNYVRQHFTNKPTYLTETGYDVDRTSPLHVPAMGNRSVLQMQGDWVYRTMLLAARKKLDRLFIYEWGDNQPGVAGLFVSTGIIEVRGRLKKRPAFNYMEQSVNVLRGFQFDTSITTTISNLPVVLDKYTKPGSDSIKWVGLLPIDSVASVTYPYQMANSAKFLRLWTHVDDQDFAYKSYEDPQGGFVNLTISQTPIIWDEVTSKPAITAPTANAGADQNLTLPLRYNFRGNTVISGTLPSITGSGSDDGTRLGYQWVQVSGPSTVKLERPYNQTSDLYNLSQGTYVFQFQVTDEDGRKATDEVTITVADAPGNTPPVANIGAADTSFRSPINSMNLSGAGSTDANGSIISYEWSKESGPTWGLFTDGESMNTTVTNMSPGTYVFRLTVRDNQGSTGTATKTVRVLPREDLPTNNPPSANAGLNISIQLPVNTVTLNGLGSDAEGGVSFQWTIVSGGTFNISNSTIQNPILTNLQAGVYTFRLTVTDNQGASAIDDVQITVNPPTGSTGRVEYATVEYFNGTCNQTVPNATIRKDQRGRLTEVVLPNGTLVPLGDMRRILATKILNQ